MTEIWKDIPGFNGDYIASNTGKIRTTIKTIVNPLRKTNRIQKNRHFYKDSLVGKKLSNKGYQRVSLNKKTYFVHRLIALTFLENINNYEQVNHIDGNKLNNNVYNLEWVSNQQNRDHAVKNKLISYGETAGHSKLSLDEVKKIIELYKTNTYTQKELASMYKVTPGCIGAIVSGRNWKLALMV